MPIGPFLPALLLTLSSTLSPLNFDHRLPTTAVIKLKPEPSPLLKTHHLPFLQLPFQQHSSPLPPCLALIEKNMQDHFPGLIFNSILTAAADEVIYYPAGSMLTC